MIYKIHSYSQEYNSNDNEVESEEKDEDFNIPSSYEESSKIRKPSHNIQFNAHPAM